MEPLYVMGNRIFAGSEEKFLRGVICVQYPYEYPLAYGYPPEPDIAAVREVTKPPGMGTAGWGGANCVGIWFDADPILADNQEYDRYITGMADACLENGAYCMFLYHSDHGRTEHPRLINTKGLDASAKIARRLRDWPNVFFASQSEPGDPNGGVAPPPAEPAELRQATELTIDAFRSEKPGVMVAVPGTRWSQIISWMATEPPNRPNIVCKVHIYDPLSTLISRGVLNVAQRMPVIIGEFGASVPDRIPIFTEIAHFAEENLSGWLAWSLSVRGAPTMFQDLVPSGHAPDMLAMVPNEWGSAVQQLLAQYYEPGPGPGPGPGPVVRSSAGPLMLGGIAIAGAVVASQYLSRR